MNGAGENPECNNRTYQAQPFVIRYGCVTGLFVQFQPVILARVCFLKHSKAFDSSHIRQ